jgi:hypothetical protein
MDFMTRFKGKTSTIGKDGEVGIISGTDLLIYIIFSPEAIKWV